jgi:hypothetical protein
MRPLRIVLGILALALVLIEVDYLAPRFAPLDSLAIAGSTAILLTPPLFCILGFILVTLDFRLEKRTKLSITSALGRLAIFVFFIIAGVYTATYCFNREIQLIQLSDADLHVIDRITDLQNSVGFKVGYQMSRRGKFLFFKRTPGAAEKVEEWLHQDDAKKRRT